MGTEGTFEALSLIVFEICVKITFRETQSVAIGVFSISGPESCGHLKLGCKIIVIVTLMGIDLMYLKL